MGLGRFLWKQSNGGIPCLSKNTDSQMKSTIDKVGVRSIGKGRGDETQVWLTVWGTPQSPHLCALGTYFLSWHLISFIFLQGWVVQKTSSPVQMGDVFHGPWLEMGKRIVKMAQMNHRSAKFSWGLNWVSNWVRKIWAIWSHKMILWKKQNNIVKIKVFFCEWRHILLREGSHMFLG